MSLSLRWLGHAGFQITTKEGKKIYIDPYEGIYEEKADLILITHSHQDHCDPSKIEKIRKRDTIVVGPSDCAQKIKGNLTSIKSGDKKTFDGTIVEAVAAYNIKRFRSPGIPFHPKGLGVGYIITIEGKTIYHTGDTDLIPEMKKLGKVDLALMPSGGTYTMDNQEAAEATLDINPRAAIPIHRCDTNPKEFRKIVEGSSSTRVVLLKAGDRYDI